jgi:hypothetical protein
MGARDRDVFEAPLQSVALRGYFLRKMSRRSKVKRKRSYMAKHFCLKSCASSPRTMSSGTGGGNFDWNNCARVKI